MLLSVTWSVADGRCGLHSGRQSNRWLGRLVGTACIRARLIPNLVTVDVEQESWPQDEVPDTQHALNPAQVDRFRIVRQVEIVLLRPTDDTGSYNNPRPAERLAHRSAPHHRAGNGRATKDRRPSVG
jgi:hypothetical protein